MKHEIGGASPASCGTEKLYSAGMQDPRLVAGIGHPIWRELEQAKKTGQTITIDLEALTGTGKDPQPLDPAAAITLSAAHVLTQQRPLL